MKPFDKLLTLGAATMMLSQPALAAEGTPNIEFGGRIQADNTDFRNDKYPYADGSELRRARVFLRGDLDETWDYKVQFDFAAENTALKDGYVRYNGIPNSRITVGNFKQFTSLEQLTSSNNITFAERALPNALVTDRRMGIGFQNWSDRYSIAVSAYGHEANNLVRGKGYGGRFVYRPALGSERLLHLGVALAAEEDQGEISRLRARPESHQDSHRIVDTGKQSGIKGTDTIALEAAYVRGRFSAQTEFIRQTWQRRVGPDLSFDGYYAYASYFLSDDSRPYSTSNASFGTVSPSSDKGAWEIAARISSLDLSDRDIAGGKTDILTLGINYYMTQNLRFTANYIMADSDGAAGNDAPDALQLRVRFTF